MNYHFMCARKAEAQFQDDKKVYCAQHSFRTKKQVGLIPDILSAFSRGHYPIHQQAWKGFNYFVTLRLISKTCSLHCGKDKTDSDSHVKIAGIKSLQAD